MSKTGRTPLHRTYTLSRRLLLVASLAVPLSAQTVPTFRTGVFLNHIDAEVLSDDRRPIDRLKQDDFVIVDDGKEQAIVSLSVGDQPLDLILLFDISASMGKQVEKVAEVARKGLDELRLGDRVAVMVFNRRSRLTEPFSENLETIEQAINGVPKLRFGGGTWIQDAVRDAACEFLKSGGRDRQRHRAVIVITDDLGVPARHQWDALEDLWEADALVSGLIVPNHMHLRGLLAPIGSTRLGGIEGLVEKTGGDIIRSDDMGMSFPEMMRRIRNRYTLYYKLPEGQVGSLRKINIRLSTQAAQRLPGVRVLARSAYRLRQRDQYGFASR